MPNYKEMYFTLMNATETALNTLIEAQRQCEELYVEAKDPELMVLPVKKVVWDEG